MAMNSYVYVSPGTNGSWVTNGDAVLEEVHELLAVEVDAGRLR